MCTILPATFTYDVMIIRINCTNFWQTLSPTNGATCCYHSAVVNSFQFLLLLENACSSLNGLGCHDGHTAYTCRQLFRLRHAPPASKSKSKTYITDTGTRVVININIQASSENISVQLSIHLSLTVECAIGLTVGGALQMHLLWLLLLTDYDDVMWCTLGNCLSQST